MARRRILRIVLVVVGAAALLCLLIYLVVMVGYERPWTGFAGYTDADGKLVPPKRLWDWMSLLIVPLALAVAAWGLNNARKTADARVENDRQRQKSLDDYFAWMTEIIVAGSLLNEQTGDKVRALARSRTLTILGALDGDRKAQILQFLYEAGMIESTPTIQLIGADLSGAVLDGATLSRSELRGVDFKGASFLRANLTNADLRGCDFAGADFTGARLTDANLEQAILKRAKLQDTALANTILKDVDLTFVKLPSGVRHES